MTATDGNTIASSPPSAAARGSPSRAATVYATVALFTTNFVAYLDRSVLALFVQPVKSALRLSDGEIGLLLGAAFVVTFTIAGLLMGRLVDRLNRRNLLIVCVAIWSASTIGTGLARSWGEMFVARMGVGVGEAALFPTAISLFADFFTPEKRGRPYGVFTTGLYAGGGAALVAIGAMLPGIVRLSQRLAADGTILEPWRLVMFTMIVPGLLCMLALAFMREPPRRQRVASTTDRLISGFGTWMTLRHIFLPHHLAISLITLSLYGLNAWMPTALIREHGYSARAAGLIYGLVVAGTGMAGAFVGGIAADRASRFAGVAGRMWVVLTCATTGSTGFLVIYFASTPPVLLLGSVIASALLGAGVIAGIMVMSDLSPDHSRGQITAIYFVFAGIIGTAGGPAIVGQFSDALGPYGSSLTGIIGGTGMLAGGLGAVLAWITLARVRRTTA